MKKIETLVGQLIFVMGSVLTAYLAISTFYMFQNLAVFHATYIIGIMVISALTYLQKTIRDHDSTKSTFGLFKVFVATGVLFVSTGVTTYIALNADRLQTEQPFLNSTDTFVGWLLVGVLIFLTTAHWGKLFGGVVTAVIAYFFLGHLIPIPILAHMEYTPAFVLSYLGMSVTNGVFLYAGVVTDQIYFLLMFATFILSVGLLQFFLELGKLVGKRVQGGAAFPAVVGSTLVGSVMGQAIGNVMLTGQLTIPMMKEHGFKASTAGAIEVVASTSGQLMPPILGLAAFIMAAYLNEEYVKIALSATYPAVAYVCATTVGILLNARRQGMGYLTGEIDKEVILRMFPTFAIPFAIVLVLLLLYYSPSFAGIIGIIFILICSVFQGKRLRPSSGAFLEAIRNGINIAVMLGLIVAAVGPIAQVAITTQIAARVGAFLAMVLPPILPLLLIFTMFISLVAGMGLPTPVAYLLVALTVAPFLQEIGLNPIPAHFFAFYFAIFSTLTPPVAIGVLVSCKISNASFFDTAIEALKLALPAFVVPFAFVLDENFFEFPHVSLDGLKILFITCLISVAFSVATNGYLLRRLTKFERIVGAVITLIGITYLFTGSYIALFGFLGFFALGSLWTWLSARRDSALQAV